METVSEDGSETGSVTKDGKHKSMTGIAAYRCQLHPGAWMDKEKEGEQR